jgi:HAMP domain-containing protein
MIQAAKNMAITALQYDFTGVMDRSVPPTPERELEQRKAVNVLNNFKQEMAVDYLLLTDESGRVLFRANNPAQMGDALASLDPLLSQSLAEGSIIFGSVKLPIDFIALEQLESSLELGVQKRRVESALAMEVVVPLRVREELQGALVIGDVINNDNTLVDNLKTMVFQDNIQEGSATIYLGDVAVASSRAGEFGRGVGENVTATISELVNQQGKEFIGPEEIGDTNYISAYVPIKDFNNQVIGIYAVSVRETWFLEFETYIRTFILIVIGVAIIFSILLTYIAAGRLTRPIEDITEAANKISLGDLDVSIQVGGAGDEISELGESLERMRISLKSAIERLRRR